MQRRTSERIRCRATAGPDPRNPLTDFLVPFRPARVHVLLGGSPQTYTGAAAIRKDGWLEFSSQVWTTPTGKVLHGVPFVHFPPERVQLVEWLKPDPLKGPPGDELAFLAFEPARILAQVCGLYDQLTGLAAQLHLVWLDFRPAGVWRLRPTADPAPEVQAVSFPRHTVHLLEWIYEEP